MKNLKRKHIDELGNDLLTRKTICYIVNQVLDCQFYVLKKVKR